MPLVLFGLAACGNAMSGDHVSYAVWNRDSSQELQDIRVMAADGKYEVLCSQLFAPAAPPGAIGWQFGGITNLPEGKHRMPKRMTVSWRLPPREGQETQQGDVQGPYDLDYETAVPEDVRALVRNSRKYQLEFAVGIGKLPLVTRWRLVEWSGNYEEHKEVRRGGDWH